MRKLIVCNIMSLDGYFSGPDNNVMVLPMDEFFDEYNAERLRAADMLLLGRNTYEGFKSFWPTVPENAEFLQRLPPARREVELEISRLNNAIQKVVVSDSLRPEQTEPWQQSTRILRRAEAHERIAELKAQSGKDILVFGSRILWNDLLAKGLVDELHLMIGNAILGGGTPAFSGAPPVSLRLFDTVMRYDSNNVIVRYEVHRE